MEKSSLFQNKKPDIEKLLSFGFTLKNDGSCYTYTANMLDGQLQCMVTIFKTGKVNTKVIDTATKETYILHQIPSSSGAFVGKVKAEYENILRSISTQCFVLDVFKSTQAKMIIQYVKEKYNNEFEYLWTKFPNNAVCRRKDNAKWYIALLTVAKEKIGLSGTDIIEIVDLRISPQEIAAIIDGENFFPGYHMNKKHWFTIRLDHSVPIEKIYTAIDNSYQLAGKK